MECTHCGESYATRNALFKHLRADCDPAAPRSTGSKARSRLVLACGYLGADWHGCARAHAAEGSNAEDTRPTVEGQVAAAIRAVWGPNAVAGMTEAVCTAKRESAARNVLVVTMSHEAGLEGRPPLQAAAAAALRAALPCELELLAAPRLVPPSLGQRSLAAIGRAVCRKTTTVLVPYSGLLHGAGRSSARAAAAEAVASGPGFPAISEPALMLIGFGEGGRQVPHAEVAELLSAAAGAPLCPRFHGGNWCTATVLREPDAPGGPGSAPETAAADRDAAAWASIDRAVAALDTSALHGMELVAMRWPEAAAKLTVHTRLKAALMTLRAGRSFHNFVEAGLTGKAAEAAAVAAGSSVGADADDADAFEDLATPPVGLTAAPLGGGMGGRAPPPTGPGPGPDPSRAAAPDRAPRGARTVLQCRCVGRRGQCDRTLLATPMSGIGMR